MQPGHRSLLAATAQAQKPCRVAFSLPQIRGTCSRGESSSRQFAVHSKRKKVPKAPFNSLGHMTKDERSGVALP